jgi:hypothetical protein
MINSKNKVVDFVMMFGFITVGLLSFIFLLYVPAYNKLGWHYPFGWDTPLYLMWSRRILEEGYLTVVLEEKYPFGTSLFISFLARLIQNDLIKAGIIYPIFCLATLQALICLIYYKVYGSSLFAGALALIVPYFHSIHQLMAHLYQQLLYTAVLPILFYYTATYIVTEKTSNLVKLLLPLIIGWFIWPYGTYLSSLILISPLFTKINFITSRHRIEIRVNKAIVFCFLIGILFLTSHIFWQLFIFKVYFTGLLIISSTRPPYTLENFFGVILGSNYVLLALFFTGLITSTKIPSTASNYLFKKTTSNLIVFFNMIILAIILLTPDYIVELKYRLDKIVFSYWFIIVGLQFIAKKFHEILVSNKNLTRSRKKYYNKILIKGKIIEIFITAILVVIILISLFPSGIPFHWRRWLPVDDKRLVEELSLAKKELDIIFSQGLNPRPIILSDNCLEEGRYFLVKLYIWSFFPYSYILCDLSGKHYVETFASSFGHILNNHIPNLNTRYYNNTILLILKELFKETHSLPDSCQISLRENGFCLILLEDSA